MKRKLIMEILPKNSINDEKRKKSFRCCSRGRGRCNESSEFFHGKNRHSISYHIYLYDSSINFIFQIIVVIYQI
ncbi:hypothetical protein DERP_008081 [Dermatophagoides pteronyssinus]|uniref:Uncharacterized protein n=1 Tax=Dermatophagoides pteronyssinus TaxID=6956 RepID=A0ABQ8JJP2_DERPT|nr:hypothetical protein DERP_008081 [Dermatophagoides pteronyssinus]